MIFLLLSITFSALLVVMFKVFERRGIPVFPAIVVNYVAATISAFFFLPNQEVVYNCTIFSYEWFPFAMMLGSLFIVIFNLTGITTLRYGVSTSSVAMKLGLVFPVLLAFMVYGEPFNMLKLLGILMAFAAVVLSSVKDSEPTAGGKASTFAILPLIVFLGSGTCDSLTQFANKRYLGQSGIEEFSLVLFAAAATAGLAIFGYRILRYGSSLSVGSVVGGVVLGVINYFSFYFILKALATVSWGSSVVFPVSNLGTVAAATGIGVLFFNETISRTNAIGLLLAALSITSIIASNYV